MLRRYRFELILILLIICALVASRFFFTNTNELAATRCNPVHRTPTITEKAPRPSSLVWRNTPLTIGEPPGCKARARSGR